MNIAQIVRENPVAVQGSIFGVVSAGLLLLQEFGVPITQNQGIAIGGFVGALFVVWLVLLRAQVTPVSKVAAQVSNGTVVAGEASPLPNGVPVVVESSQNLKMVDEEISNTPDEDEQIQLASAAGARRSFYSQEKE